MKKLFFSALVAVVAGSAAYASVGTNSAPGDVYLRENPNVPICTLIPECYTGPGAPCTLAPLGTYYIDGCVVTPTANFK